MRTVYTYLKLITLVATVAFYTACGGDGGGGDGGASPTTTTINHNFLFFNSCEGGCSSYNLYKYYINDGTFSQVGSGNLAEVDYDYDKYRSINTVLDGKLYFNGDDGTNGNELWVYDPSVPESPGINPKMIKDINPGAASSGPESFITHDGKLYFSADTAAEGQELWVYDPSVAISATNPKIVIDASSGTNSFAPSYLVVVNNKIYMRAVDQALGNELFVYDPAVAASATNPSLVYDIRTGAVGSDPLQLVTHNGKIYFSATTSATGRELFVYDPAVAASATNPQLVYDLNPGTSGAGVQHPEFLNNKLYFTSNNGTSGEELFVYDPTLAASGTNPQLVYDIIAGGTGAAPYYLEGHNGKLYFYANSASLGYELYIYDPSQTASATNPQIYDLEAGTDHSFPHYMVSFDEKIYLGIEVGSTWNFTIFDDSEAIVPGTNPNPIGTAYEDWIYDIRPLTYSETITE